MKICITCIVYKIQSLKKKEEKNYASRFTPSCEIIVTKYTFARMKEIIFLKMGCYACRVSGGNTFFGRYSLFYIIWGPEHIGAFKKLMSQTSIGEGLQQVLK